MRYAYRVVFVVAVLVTLLVVAYANTAMDTVKRHVREHMHA